MTDDMRLPQEMNAHFGIRFLQGCFTIAAMVLTIILTADRYVRHSEVSFLLFASIWTLLTIIYLVASQFMRKHHARKYLVLVLDLLSTVFWLSGFVALTVYVNRVHYFPNHRDMVVGLTVLAGCNWGLFAGTTSLAIDHVLETRGGWIRLAPEMHASASTPPTATPSATAYTDTEA